MQQGLYIYIFSTGNKVKNLFSTERVNSITAQLLCHCNCVSEHLAFFSTTSYNNYLLCPNDIEVFSTSSRQQNGRAATMRLTKTIDANMTDVWRL